MRDKTGAYVDMIKLDKLSYFGFVGMLVIGFAVPLLTPEITYTRFVDFVGDFVGDKVEHLVILVACGVVISVVAAYAMVRATVSQPRSIRIPLRLIFWGLLAYSIGMFANVSLGALGLVRNTHPAVIFASAICYLCAGMTGVIVFRQNPVSKD